MATLVFSALGTVFGGPLGGALGALIGRQVDNAIFGSPSREGPRLKELSATTSSYGSPLPRHFGRMRASGTIIWATDLVEHRDTQGGGKGRPSVTSYTYTASFAVALASRPLTGIGRIWADGNILRGASGDLKTGGTLRIYTGRGDQQPDPLITAAESPQPCPGFRDVAYVVFEDLQLADFGNRIPALTFEIFADDGDVDLTLLCNHTSGVTIGSGTLNQVIGMTQEASLADTLGQIQPVNPLFFDVSDDLVAIAGETSAPPIQLRAPSAAVSDKEFGSKTGMAISRSGSEPSPSTLRYYDVGRDYQPGLQRATGQVPQGRSLGLEVPVAMEAARARDLIEAAARRASWARQTVSWRTSEIDPHCRPGTLVTIPDMVGIWRVMSWEWRSSGLELNLVRTPFNAAPAPLSLATDTGRASTAPDRSIGATWLAALELPWDGTGGGDLPVIRVAASSAEPGWSGAALYLDDGDGQLTSIGATGRSRATAGTSAAPIGSASSLIMDRHTVLEIELLGDDMTLTDASRRQLAMGANRAQLGREIIQFGRAVPLGERRWRLSMLMRGRGGTEQFVGGHAAGEIFVLLDDSLSAIDGAMFAQNPTASVKAIGAADDAPIVSTIHGRGLTQRPLFPVHPRVSRHADGSLELAWTRRARAAWAWRDQVDAPLHEQAETYEVILGTETEIAAMWVVQSSGLTIPASVVTALTAAHATLPLIVRQRGSYASSAPLFLAYLS